MQFKAAPHVAVRRYRYLVTLELYSTVEVTVDLTFKNAHNADKYQDPKVTSTVKATAGETSAVTTGETTSVPADSTETSTLETAVLQHAQACIERDCEHFDAL